MEFNEETVKQIIQDEIKNFSMNQLRDKKSTPEKEVSVKTDYDRIKELEEIDNFIFNGGEAPKKSKSFKGRYMNEEDLSKQSEDPNITQSEILDFEKQFREKVSSLVIFSKKEDGSTNFDLYKGDSGIEAKVSGTIPLKAENRIDWSFSLQNGPYINVNAELNNEVAEILGNMSFFFNEWKTSWVEKLTELPN